MAVQSFAGFIHPPTFLFTTLAIALSVHFFVPWPLLSLLGCSMWRRALWGLALLLASVYVMYLAITTFRAHGEYPSHMKETNTIVSNGVFALTRNPMYVSFLLLCLAVFVMSDSVWLLVATAVVFGFLQVLVIPREEAFMSKNFGTEYLNYTLTVPRWPGLYFLG
eukprot:gb/GEZN01010511.1/.p1 GENE.gb/GEZN01010511.1/~~gb/GEZN01010511.1/.p1  ORF type:complete len:165 (+),score=10.33 gb/GEZN01010511.1/:228-722(+)